MEKPFLSGSAAATAAGLIVIGICFIVFLNKAVYRMIQPDA